MSKTLYGAKVSGYRIAVAYNEAIDVEKNQTTITAALWLMQDSGYNIIVNPREATITINGTVKNLTTNAANGYNQKHLGTVTHVVPHNADGTKKINISAYYPIQVQISGYGWIQSLSLGSTEITLPTIPRASNFTANSTIAIGTGLTVNVTKHASAFTHKAIFKYGNVNMVIASNVAGSFSWIPPDNLATTYPTLKSIAGALIVETYSGNNLIGSKSQPLTVTVPNIAKFQPKGEIIWTDIKNIRQRFNNHPWYSGSMDTWQLLKKHSQLQIDVEAWGYSFAVDIASIVVETNGQKLTRAPFITNPINVDSLVIKATITDVRGFSTVLTTTIEVTSAYDTPQMNLKSARRISVSDPTNPSATYTEDNKGLYALLDLTVTHAPMVSIDWRKVGTTTWTGSQLLSSPSNPGNTNGKVWIGQPRPPQYAPAPQFDSNSRYEFKVSADSFLGTVTQTFQVYLPTAFTLLNFHENGRGVAIGKVSESGSLEVALPTRFHRGIGIPDTRSIVSVPQDLPRNAVSFEFKQNSSVGNPPITASSLYSHIINVVGWSSHEGSGGWPTQISVGASGFAVRKATSATAWGAWKSITNTSSSSREIKKDIENTNHQENFDVFKGLKVYDYNLKEEPDEKKTREKDHIGLITDEVPDFLTDKNQSYIKIYDLLSLTVSTLQTTIKKVETLELKVKDLENEIEKLKGGNQ